MIELVERKVAILPIRDPDKSPTGLLWVPEEAKERVDQGIIYKLGPKCELGYHVGMHVLFGGYVGKLIYVEEGTRALSLMIMDETDLDAELHDEGHTDLEIPGLFFKGSDGQFYTANIELSLEMIAYAMQENPNRTRFKSRSRATS